MGAGRGGLVISLALLRRNLLLVRRTPSVFIPSLVLPLLILVATAGAFRGIGALPEFRGASYVAFTLPMAATMGAGFAGINSGLTLARDLEGGFFARLQASPAPRLALIAGPLGAAAARSLFTTTVILLAGLVAGVPPATAAGTLTFYLLAMGFASATSCWALGVALRTRRVGSAPVMQVAVFLAIFTSVAYAPREALSGPLRTIADYNPVTPVLEAARSAELTGLAWPDIWPAVVALAGLLLVLGAFALRGLAALTRE
jgi:ABC-2 type transport system permease protein